MKKLPPPPRTFPQALAAAISGIGDKDLRDLHTTAFVGADITEAQYRRSAHAGTLFQLPRLSGRDDPIVLAPLRKSQLVKLYTQYFVPEDKPARSIYDEIMVAAGGKCPLCGGVGHVRTLDHYLPKAISPLYSVLPSNLVPSCRDCNTDRGGGFATEKGRQTLHLYFDDDRFFSDKWLHARIIPGTPPVVDYFVSPPIGWDVDDIARVRNHFSDFGLASKFSVEAASDLSETILTRRTTMRNYTAAAFSAHLAEMGGNEKLPINGWRRVMFNALSSDAWFCAHPH